MPTHAYVAWSIDLNSETFSTDFFLKIIIHNTMEEKNIKIKNTNTPN